jgi:hypothetical protein
MPEETTTIHPAGLITVAVDGSVGYATVQPERFVYTSHAGVLTPKSPMSVWCKLYVCALIRNERWRFSFGRAMSGNRLNLDLRMPVKQDGEIDYEWIDTYMKSLPYSSGVKAT